ncbi:type VI secretion system baseplate subunit TssE [Budvicia aquatica]|uniref:type VI secretion system baseplate subunit TssE n=1 Tax=Budvicia aquatica TaxID=82979 RepID=UPI001D0F3295|nr:type VI secretion system baseplate subunit TssE [Budvicia aquatica]
MKWKKDNTLSLFERIRHKADRDDYRVTNDPLRSIKLNLSRILNTRPGNSQSTKDIGVIDLNDATISSTELNVVICKSIKACIEKYEPRISRATVTARSNNVDPLTMLFDITAEVKHERGIDNVEFQLRLDNERRYFLD